METIETVTMSSEEQEAYESGYDAGIKVAFKLLQIQPNYVEMQPALQCLKDHFEELLSDEETIDEHA